MFTGRRAFCCRWRQRRRNTADAFGVAPPPRDRIGAPVAQENSPSQVEAVPRRGEKIRLGRIFQSSQFHS